MNLRLLGLTLVTQLIWDYLNFCEKFKESLKYNFDEKNI